ncbi:MAG: hypothetical protein ACO2ZZ_12445, partial [Cyclobacteriaceae bacterium]
PPPPLSFLCDIIRDCVSKDYLVDYENCNIKILGIDPMIISVCLLYENHNSPSGMHMPSGNPKIEP